MRILAILILLLPVCVRADSLENRIAAAIDSTPEARQGFWGIRVVDAETGALVYARNDENFFVPASNTKLFTTSLALTRLGPDYRFNTVIHSEALPDATGSVKNLRLIGGGDPNLSARVLPYTKNLFGPNPLAHIEALADQVVAKGVRTVLGDIVGDDTAYVWEPYPDGWSVDDPVWEYGAPVSALTVNDNAFTLFIEPGAKAGDPAIIGVNPSLEWFTIHNRTTTVSAEPARISYSRLPGSRELVISGTVLLKAQRRNALLAIDDPAVFAAAALRDALLERGVRIVGTVRGLHRRNGEEVPVWEGVELARHTSAPLSQVLQVINKVSQNLHTELVLREIARIKNGYGTREGGIEEVKTFLREVGVEEKQYRFEDASGLSRLTLVTPATISKLLVYMYKTPYRDVWISTLPVGARDGTLTLRFDRNSAAENIRGKTGSISHVSSLSGYALRKDGRPYAFSILANNYNSDHAPVRKVIDRIAMALLE